MQKTQLQFYSKWPSAQGLQPKRSLIIVDQKVRKHPALQKWLQKFPFVYTVEAGETLKQIENFPGHIEKILKISQSISERPLQIICIGGGSVGDFAGFVASVFKRGVDLVQIPSTWLSAVDSAHGGKNALNSKSAKNQIGTFHPATDQEK